MTQKKSWNLHQKIFLVLIVLILFLSTLSMAKAKGWLIPKQPQIEIVDGKIELDSLTLDQKISQMIIVHGGLHNLDAWKNLQLGGIHLFAMENQELFAGTIAKFQAGMTIPFLVTADLEGCWNPFSNFKSFPAISEVDDVGEAFKKGSEEGKFLHQLGFTLNFAPVVDLGDDIWKCRSFQGSEQQVAELAEAYMLGLQNQGIIATAKHYPGKTLAVKDPHKELVIAEISAEDIYPYAYLAEKGNLKAVMVNHLITTGKIDSEGLPATSSEKVVGTLKNSFWGLIITDDSMMLGLKKFYPSVDEMYLALFKAGNDLIINFNEDPLEIYHLVQVIKEGVNNGIISETQIDRSVAKILEAKGFTVI